MRIFLKFKKRSKKSIQIRGEEEGKGLVDTKKSLLMKMMTVQSTIKIKSIHILPSKVRSKAVGKELQNKKTHKLVCHF